MAFAREIFHTILENVRFRVPTTEEKDSYYTSIGNVLIRISNHCTRLYVWDDILEKNPRYKGLPIISIVFEDEGNTFNEEECLTLKRYRMKPIKVAEHVFPIHGHGKYIGKEDINKIIASIKEIGTSQKFNDRTRKSQYFPRISKNPSNASINPDNNQIKENQNNMKKTIKLTESDLRNIIKEVIDMTGFPYNGDYATRNKWWQDKTNRDFPGKYNGNTDFQKVYMDFHDEAKKERLAKEKIDARAQKKAATAQRNAERREQDKTRRKEERQREREANGGFPSHGKVTLDKNEGLELYAEVDRENCTLTWFKGYKPNHGEDYEPVRQGVIDIEVYLDGTWLPYDNLGNVSGAIYKLFKKLGMREKDVDLDESITRAIHKYLR